MIVVPSMSALVPCAPSFASFCVCGRLHFCLRLYASLLCAGSTWSVLFSDSACDRFELLCACGRLHFCLRPYASLLCAGSTWSVLFSDSACDRFELLCACGRLHFCLRLYASLLCAGLFEGQALMEGIFFKSETIGPVMVCTTHDGQIDFGVLGPIMGFEPASITLCDVGFPASDHLSRATWTEIKNFLPAAGTRADPVFVRGHPWGHPSAWLQQRLPPLVFGSNPARVTPGSRQYKHPASTVLWDLWPAVDQYLAGAVTQASYHKRIDIEDDVASRRLTSEADCSVLYQILLPRVGRVILGKTLKVHAEERSTSSSYIQRTGIAAMVRGVPDNSTVSGAAVLASAIRVDLLLKLGDRNIVVVEMKAPTFFKTTEGNIVDLVEAFERRHHDLADGTRYHVLARVIDQLFTYMDSYRICYGIISSTDVSYFVWSGSDALHISRGVDWEDPNFVAVLSYFLDKAATDLTVYAGKEGHESHRPIEKPLEESEEKDKDKDKDKEYLGPKNQTRTGGRVSTRSMVKAASGSKGASDLKEMPQERLHLEEMSEERLHLESHPFATGWSGNVVRGIYEGVAIAVKLAVVGTDQAEALVNEASAYLKLRNCWGKYVPALISYGTTAHGYVVYVATELIVGSELEMRILTPQVVRASFEALQAIHGVGVLHGDVRRQNILVPCSGQGVRFIDFGFSRAIATEEDRRKELQELQGVIDRVWPLTRASPPRAPLRGTLSV